MSDDTINITVDGKKLTAKKGQMLIEVTDAAGIDVPRFCYHKKLSVAANCRMCLVEVEKAPKPLPACATPVMPDMVVKTRSPLAREAQKGTMEFLLINHPLDCPICDQGGECELQDVAMGYGGGVSQYTEGKRVVMDKYIGPLIATEMTRCIHCTRCVRFGDEIAGVRELGATGRGENMRIGTYIEKSVISEVSGNVIDICPVGALTARPSRFTARAWELRQVPAVSTHDSVGANIFVHLDGERVNRVVPRENESINETWISDRDRYAYAGLANGERVTQPMIRSGGELQATDWPTALEAAREALAGAGAELGVLAAASITLEELYLSQKLARALGSNNIDHRLGQSDFSADDAMPAMPWLGMQWADLETLDSALLVGSNIRKDQPLAALRLRKAALKGGRVSCLNPRRFPMHFDLAEEIPVASNGMLSELLAVLEAAGDKLELDGVDRIDVREDHRRIADDLASSERRVVLLGNLAACHPDYSRLFYVAQKLAAKTGAMLGMLPERANTAAAWLAGVVPHREAGGRTAASRGLNAADMLSGGIKRWLLVGAEPEFDCINPQQSTDALAAADAVVALSSCLSEQLIDHADVVLPIGASLETYGTWVNATGQWQSTKGTCPPPGEARPAWKVLRVLAEAFDLDGFAFDSPEAITREVQGACGDVALDNFTRFADVPVGASRDANPTAGGSLLRSGEFPIHRVDPIVRRSQPLQRSYDGAQAVLQCSLATLKSLGVEAGADVRIRQGEGEAVLPAIGNDDIPDGVVWLPTGLAETRALGALYGTVEVQPA